MVHSSARRGPLTSSSSSFFRAFPARTTAVSLARPASPPFCSLYSGCLLALLPSHAPVRSVRSPRRGHDRIESGVARALVCARPLVASPALPFPISGANVFAPFLLRLDLLLSLLPSSPSTDPGTPLCLHLRLFTLSPSFLCSHPAQDQRSRCTHLRFRHRPRDASIFDRRSSTSTRPLARPSYR